MANRLIPLPVMSFVGGLNLRASQFELASNESPDMLNVDVDPRGGFYTRKGWQRWNQDDIVGETDPAFGTWEPRNAHFHVTHDNTSRIYVANATKLYVADNTGTFSLLTGATGNAVPHQFDFASWGDDVYIVGGHANPSVRHRQPPTGPPVLDTLTPETWSEVNAPVRGVMPMAEYCETHAGYMFVADTHEDGGFHPNRIRWSHPTYPDAWRQSDYIDIDAFGGRITGLLSFNDHLLIFKTNSMWALYGYDETSWQLIRKSDSLGCPSVTATARSETAAYFYSAFGRGGVYGYNGNEPVYISENVRPAFEQMFSYENVFVSWANRRLWVGVPWHKDIGPTVDPTSLFIYDLDVGDGSWSMYRSDYGGVALVLDRSDYNAHYPLATFWSDNDSSMIILDYIDEAYDILLSPTIIGYTPGSDPNDPIGILSTSAGADIQITNSQTIGQPFHSYYRTGWLHANEPDRKKAWRRPQMICREPKGPVDLILQVYRNYDETTVHRRRVITLRPNGAKFWSSNGADEIGDLGFDWKTEGAASPDERGADWSSKRGGAQMQRAGSLGLAYAVQLKISASDETLRRAWGVDGIVTKFVPRRYR